MGTMTSTANYQRALVLMNTVDPFGPMHTAVDDGNLDNGNLDFVEGVMREKGATLEEWELLRLLRLMTEDDRFELWDEAAGFSE